MLCGGSLPSRQRPSLVCGGGMRGFDARCEPGRYHTNDLVVLAIPAGRRPSSSTLCPQRERVRVNLCEFFLLFVFQNDLKMAPPYRDYTRRVRARCCRRRESLGGGGGGGGAVRECWWWSRLTAVIIAIDLFWAWLTERGLNAVIRLDFTVNVARSHHLNC